MCFVRWLLLVLTAIFVIGCGGKKKAKDPSAEQGGDYDWSQDSEFRLEYVPISINWVKKHLKLKGEASDDDPKQLDSLARDRARRIMDAMVSRMQSSTESLDSIAEAAIKAELGPKAIADPKRRKMVTLAPDAAGTADLPPDAKEALSAFAKKAKPGAVVDSPLGSGPVLLVARAIR
jgi:hypothetical protein